MMLKEKRHIRATHVMLSIHSEWKRGDKSGSQGCMRRFCQHLVYMGYDGNVSNMLRRLDKLSLKSGEGEKWIKEVINKYIVNEALLIEQVLNCKILYD